MRQKGKHQENRLKNTHIMKMDHILPIKSKKTLKKKKTKIQLYIVSKKQLYIQRCRQTKNEITERQGKYIKKINRKINVKVP